MILLLVSLIHLSSWGNRCQEIPTAIADAKTVVDHLQSKKCSLDNDDLQSFNTVPDSTATLRLSTRCHDHWGVKTKTGATTLPAGTRVLKISQNQILFPFEGKLVQGEIDPMAFKGDPDCPQKEEKPNEAAFYAEAFFQLELAKKLDPKSNPLFIKKIDELILKLKDLQEKKVPFEKITCEWNQMLSRNQESKVEQISSFQTQLQKTYDPITTAPRKTFESTLVVPISLQWFQSTPELQKFYQETWIGSGYDLRLASGGSGEGVSYYPKQSQETNESFLQMKMLLEKTAKFIDKSHDRKLKSCPEATWLKQESRHITQYERMIFFSPETWVNNPKTSPWADYIPVDQSLGGLPSDYLLSVMVHEINVNTPNYLARDTHGPWDETSLLRKCVQKHQLTEFDQDPVTTERLLGLNSQISVIYLQMLLQRL